MASPKKVDTNKIGGLDIVPVDEQSQYINMLVYGPPGVGKTVLAGSSANVLEMAPVLFIDIEGGTLSLKDFYPEVEVVRTPTWNDLQKVYNDLYRGTHPFKTVVIDSLSEAQRFSMAQIMGQAYREDSDIDPDIPQMRHWGKNLEQTRRLIRGFRDLPMNVIFTALDMTEKDKRNNRKVYPSFTGKLKAEAPGFLDVVVYLYIKEVAEQQVRLLLTKATDEFTAKDRSNRLPAVIENPTMETLYGLITGAISKEDLAGSD